MTRKLRIALLLMPIGALLLYWWLCLPAELFDRPTSTVLNDRDGRLLAARIADDGQWRFPAADSVPRRFATCLITFEDKRFYRHPGVDVLAMLRAFRQNMQNDIVQSGASTLSMQLMRMSRQRTGRSPWQKLIEISMATRAEVRYTKSEILALYAAQAPMGGNVVGLEAAAWRYFGRPAHELSWAETATLAVLPNAPALIYPGRNTAPLRHKRDGLLTRLHEQGLLDSLSLRLAMAEPLPTAPVPLPQMAPQLLDRAMAEGHKGRQLQSTLDAQLQGRMQALVDRHVQGLSRNHIHNAALMVVHVPSGEVMAYVGNASPGPHSRDAANDMLRAARSSGSILKPLLYAQALGRGRISPKTLLADIPTQYAGFSPKNFDQSYSGALPADEALARSLNIPYVRLLRDYGVPVFHKDLNDMGFTTMRRTPSHYGLSLILGGAECSPWDLSLVYRKLAAQLSLGSSVDALPAIHYDRLPDPDASGSTWPMDRGAAWAAAEAMTALNRPDSEGQWKQFSSARRIAWKTGTSYGFRDAWAVGLDPEYVVTVWVGNASGEGRPGITGIHAAAPLLFEAFGMLPASRWFDAPVSALTEAELCAHSGMRATARCGRTTVQNIPTASLQSKGCNYCRWVHTSADGRYRMHQACADTAGLLSERRFLLPALQEHFYRKGKPGYRGLPPWHPDCEATADEDAIRLIYPRDASRVFMPRDVDGSQQAAVLKAVHRDDRATLHWHLDAHYLGSTSELHHMEVVLGPGKYHLRLLDEEGHGYSTMLSVVH